MPESPSEHKLPPLVINVSAVAPGTPQAGYTSKSKTPRGHTLAETPKGGLTRLPANITPPRFARILDSQVTTPCRSCPDLAVGPTVFKLAQAAGVRSKKNALAPTAASLARKAGMEVPSRRPRSKMEKFKGKENIRPVLNSLSNSIPKGRVCAGPLSKKPIKSGRNNAGRASTTKILEPKTKSDWPRFNNRSSRKTVPPSITNKLERATTTIRANIQRIHTKLKPARAAVPPKGQGMTRTRTRTVVSNQTTSLHPQPDLAVLTTRIDELFQITTNLSTRLSSEIEAQRKENQVLRGKLHTLRDEVAEMFIEWEVKFKDMGKNVDGGPVGSDMGGKYQVPQKKRKLREEEEEKEEKERQKDTAIERPRKRIST